MAEAARVIDRLELAPRFDEEYAARLNRRFAAADARELLRGVIRDKLAGDAAVVSSFGAESAVLLHLVAEIDPGTPVIFLDTGRHFAETLAYRDTLVARLSLTHVIVARPDPAVLVANDEAGLRWSWDPDGCCDLRKVAPLARAVMPFDATITGRKAFQGRTRANLPSFEIDRADPAGRLKINPLAGWSREDVASYFTEHDLPAHPLTAQGYLSIGCSPCTSRIAPGEDPRAGRWRGWDKTECGIHGPGGTASELPPGYDPVF